LRVRWKHRRTQLPIKRLTVGTVTPCFGYRDVARIELQRQEIKGDGFLGTFPNCRHGEWRFVSG
jgi:hypothetical protein